MAGNGVDAFVSGRSLNSACGFTPPARARGIVLTGISVASGVDEMDAMALDRADVFVCSTNSKCGLDFTPPPQHRPRNRQSQRKKDQTKFVSSPGMIQSKSIDMPDNEPVGEPVKSLLDEMQPPLATCTPTACKLLTKTFPAPSTPVDVASTKWRTVRCPMAPCPCGSARDSSGSSTPCSGLVTPSNEWNRSDTPGPETPQPADYEIQEQMQTTYAGALEVGAFGSEQFGVSQFGVSPAALSLAISSAKLGATLQCGAGPSVHRAHRQLGRPLTLEPLVETGLTVDSLPDMALPNTADGQPSEASDSPRSIGPDGSHCQE